MITQLNTEQIEQKIRCLEQIFEREGNKCIVKMHIEIGEKDESKDGRCTKCDGYSSSALCSEYIDINHLIHYYKKFL